MDLDGDSDDGLDLIWGEPEPKIELPQVPALPTRGVGLLLLLTAGLGGLQGIFALIFSNGSAHLNSLGLSKPILALVWMAGPVAGMTLQPYFGICSDQCRSPWGRRRPFIARGTLAAVMSLIGLASAEKLAQQLVRLWTINSSHVTGSSSLAAGIAVAFFVVLNVAVQPIQGGIRALLADACPRSQQLTVNAVAGTVVSASNIFSYSLAFIDLPNLGLFRTFGINSQFSILCVATSVTLVISTALTCVAVRERSPILDDIVLRNVVEEDSKDSVLAKMVYLCTSFPRLPQQVRQVCKVQFFSWMGWFPFLFYMTTYIGDKYKASQATSSGSSSATAQEVQATSTRIGSFGLLLFALVALVAGAVLPLAHKHASDRNFQMVFPSGIKVAIRRPCSISSLWIISQVLYAFCMVATFFISSLHGVCVLVGLSGVSWAITIWAPYAIISTQVSHDGDGGDDNSRGTYSDSSKPLVLDSGESEEDGDQQRGHYDEDGESSDEDSERRPGIAFGLHNAAIAGPQIVAAAVCSLMFWILEGKSQDEIGWVLRAGGLAALGAAVLAKGIKDEHSKPSEESLVTLDILE